MKSYSSALRLLCAIALLSPAAVASPETSPESSDSKGNDEDQNSFQCGIYLAESSIPNAGFGIFTTKAIRAGGKVQPYSESPSIVVLDDEAQGMDEPDWNHVDYVWFGSGPPEHEAHLVSESVMTFGSLCNFHTLFKNVGPSSVSYDDTILDRFSDPGAGAISYHNGPHFKAKRPIPAGSELFADYGEDWLDQREGTFADFVPRKKDYFKAHSVMDVVKTDLLDSIGLTDQHLAIVNRVSQVFSERVSNAMPDTVEKFNDFQKLSKSSRSNTKFKNSALQAGTEALAKAALGKRDVDWIKNKGMCLERVKPGKSTIPGAGRGAFAQEFIKKDSIVMPAPLLNIPDRNNLKMYDLVDEEGEKVKKDDVVKGHQLLLNYCFSHRNSTMTLCPQTNMILVNHCSSRKVGGGECDERGPNAKVQWGLDWDKDTEKWLNYTMEEITDLTIGGVRGLSFEVIATRDIAVGEEIFYDYGENWEKAWEDHVANWKPEKSDYVPMKTMIEKAEFKTVDELETDPYPDNIQMFCYSRDLKEDEEESDDDDDEINEISESGRAYRSPTVAMDVQDLITPCEILEKTSEEEFTVRLIVSSKTHYIMKNYPKVSVTFRMQKYKSDQHLPGAFRHFIEIDDDMLPDQWRNVE